MTVSDVYKANDRIIRKGGKVVIGKTNLFSFCEISHIKRSPCLLDNKTTRVGIVMTNQATRLGIVIINQTTRVDIVML